jgi:hypothetical protein
VATFVNDTFTDTNAVGLLSHTGETGANWIKITGINGSFVIQSNRAYQSVVGAAYYASGVPAAADYEVEATITMVTVGVNQQLHVGGRYSTGADTGYVAFVERVSTGGGTWNLRMGKYAAGVFTQLGSTTALTTPSVGDDHTAKLRMVGDQISAYYDSTLLIGPVTDSTITTAGKALISGRVTASTSSTGMHANSITATDISLPKVFSINQAVKRAAYF